MAASLVKNVGSTASSNSLTVVVTVPAAGVAAGNILMVRLGRSAAGDAAPTVTDTQGNTYTNAVSNTGTVSGYTFRCLVGTSLVSGNTITATYSGMANRISVVDEFSGVDNAEEDDNNGGGTSTTPSSGAISQSSAVCLVFGHVAVAGGTADTYTQDADSAGGDTWHTLTRAQSNNVVTSNGAYKITTSAVSQTYNPTITNKGWSAGIVALTETAGGGGGFVPFPRPRGLTGGMQTLSGGMA
jgi:hypothetical protein